MSASQPSAPHHGPPEPDPPRAAQLYATHCRPGDYVLGGAEFSVWRASLPQDQAHRSLQDQVRDQVILRFARDYPALKLPLDMAKASPPPRQTPRRLALVPCCEGKKVALIHSAYLPTDTRGRPGNYLTHFLIYDAGALSPLEALQAWGSTAWRTQSYGADVPKQLEPYCGVPRGDRDRIDDAALANFLADDATPSPNQDLEAVVFPDRMRGDSGRRRAWLRAAIQGYLLATQGAEPGRERFYILAEPGVVALLLYGVARLLPAPLVRELTFSTYEPMSNSNTPLREFHHTRVVGTYTADRLTCLDSEFLERRGYGIDTFTAGAVSDELRADPPAEESQQRIRAALDQLIDLAAGKRWAELPELHEIWATWDQPDALENLGEALDLQARAHRLKQGNPRIEDPFLLVPRPFGAALLKAHRDAVLVCLCRLADEGVQLDSTVVPADEGARLFREILCLFAPSGDPGTVPLPATPLLLAWCKITPPAARRLPAELRWLLEDASPTAYDKLAVAGLDPHDLGRAACRALARPDGPTGVDLLKNDTVLEGFVVALADESDRARILDRLLTGDRPAVLEILGRLARSRLAERAGRRRPLVLRMFDRLVRSRSAPHPRVLDSLVDALLRQETHLADALEHLPPESELAVRLWDRCMSSIDLATIVGRKDPRVLQQLSEARVAIPEKWKAALDDWQLLSRHLASPQRDATKRLQEAEQLQQACRRRGITRAALLAARLGKLRSDPAEDSNWFAQFVAAARVFYPTDQEAFDAWLRLVGDAGLLDPEVIAYQSQFLHAVPSANRGELARLYAGRLRPYARRVRTEVLRDVSGSAGADPGPSGWRRPGWGTLLAVGLVMLIGVGYLLTRLSSLSDAAAEARAEADVALAQLEGAEEQLESAEERRKQLQEEKEEADRRLEKANAEIRDLQVSREDAKRQADNAAAKAKADRAVADKEAEGWRYEAREYYLTMAGLALATDKKQLAAELVRTCSDRVGADRNDFKYRDFKYRFYERLCSDGGFETTFVPTDLAKQRLESNRYIGNMAALETEIEQGVRIPMIVFHRSSGKNAQAYGLDYQNENGPMWVPRGKVIPCVNIASSPGARALAFISTLAPDHYSIEIRDPKDLEKPLLPILQFTGSDEKNEGPLVIVGPDPRRMIVVWAESFDEYLFVNDKWVKKTPKSPEKIKLAGIAYSPDLAWLALCPKRGKTIELRDIVNEVPDVAGENRLGVDFEVLGLVFSADSHRLVAFGDDGRLRIWEAPFGPRRPSRSLSPSDPRGFAIRCAAFSARRQVLATGSADGMVKLWEVDTGRELLCLSHAGPIQVVGFSPDNHALAALGTDNTVGKTGSVKVWVTNAGWDEPPSMR